MIWPGTFELALQKIDENIDLSFANNGAEGLQKLKEDSSFLILF